MTSTNKTQRGMNEFPTMHYVLSFNVSFKAYTEGSGEKFIEQEAFLTPVALNPN